LQAMRRAQPTLSPVPVAAMLSAGAPQAPPPPPSPFAQPAGSLPGERSDGSGLAASAAALPRVRRLPVSPFQGASTRWLMGPGRPAEDPFPLSEVRTAVAPLPLLLEGCWGSASAVSCLLCS
jgi:hypothetical protein